MSQTRIKVYGRIVDISTPGGQVAHQILRQCEIFEDSARIINTSNNLATVMGRLPVYEKSLYFLAQCSDSNLTALHLKSKSQFKNMYNSWLTKKPAIINKAVSRSCKAAIEHARTLKTEKGQFKHMIAYCNNSLAIPGLSPESVNFLIETRQNMENSLKAVGNGVSKQEKPNL